MLKAPRFLFPLAGALILCSTAFADTVVLTTGEKIEGKVISETATELTIEVKVSAGITDRTVIEKSKVAKVEKEQPDEIAWLTLKNLKPGANSLPVAQYAQVTGPLRSFLSDYPKSAHAAEASKILAAFNDEQKRVEGGEMRLGDKWLTKAEVAKEGYQISAQQAYTSMRARITAGDMIGALNTFDQIEKNYPGARSFPDAVEAAKVAHGALKSVVDRAQQNYQLQQTEFEKGVANAGEPQKSELIAARERELAQGEAAVAAAEKAGLNWPALVARSDKSLSVIAQKIPTEQQRLATLEVAKMRESLQLTDKVKTLIAAKKADAADESLRKANELWAANELATRLQPEVESLKATASAEPPPATTTEPAKTTTAEGTTEATAATPDEPAAPAVEEEKSFWVTPGGIIVILILLGLAFAAWKVFSKLKHRANDILE